MLNVLLLPRTNLSVAHFVDLKTSTPGQKEFTYTWNLEEIERNHIMLALKHFSGDKYETSSALGISLSSLYRKLDKIQQQQQAPA